MTRLETEAKIAELEEELLEAQDELKARPTNTIEVEVIKEVTIENSAQSDTIGELAKALCACQKEFIPLEKNSAAHKYNYASLTSVIQYAQPIFTKNGLAITQHAISKIIGKGFFSGVKTILMHESGEWTSSEAYCVTMKTKMNSTVQMFGVNTSYIRRYQYQAILGLATADSDGVG